MSRARNCGEDAYRSELTVHQLNAPVTVPTMTATVDENPDEADSAPSPNAKIAITMMVEAST